MTALFIAWFVWLILLLTAIFVLRWRLEPVLILTIFGLIALVVWTLVVWFVVWLI